MPRGLHDPAEGPLAPDPDPEDEARLQYTAIRAAVAAGARVTVLHIGARQTVLATGTDREPAVVLALAIGSARTASDQFRRDPPAPIEMENAIMVVEDEVTRARDQAVEQTFDRFSGVVLGRPAAGEGLPRGGAFAATLLILRELMHHLKFSAITVLA